MPGKISKILVCGHAGVGKTAAIEQLIYGNHTIGMVGILNSLYNYMPMHSTIEDIYTAMIETDRGVKEKVRIYDTGGLDGIKAELPRHYFAFPDGFVLFYDVTSWDSFQKLDKIKKDIDKFKEKREVHIIAIGNKSEQQETRQVDFNTAQAWANKEKVRLWEASVKTRQSLIDPFQWLTNQITKPQTKGKYSYVAAQQMRLTLQLNLKDLPGKSTFLPGRKAKTASTNLEL
ncbi:hypothetical protein FSP39_003742 [Pinctada imbricata]|uniref:NF-kappa-B inhibitor-interacting Ras-like protein 1 n=1 Tax=Pinctada imbricata TaxID=66713 RepID=A0AA88XQ65_PINIB|nr:hypothetical protein FSP39_003742 [Pinctada imbricata]